MRRVPRQSRASLVAAAALLGLSSMLVAPATAQPVAFDTFDATLNRTNFTQNPAPGAFGNAGDGFEVYQRGVSATVPFQLLDDTASVFPADALGIIKESKTDRWFGITDTVNPANPTGATVAEWTFLITGAEFPSVSIDMGAMGDFEAADSFVWTYSIDGGPLTPLFSVFADESASLLYTLDSGTQVSLNDPLQLNGVFLNNNLATFSAPLSGTGNQLVIRLNAVTDGGEEGYVFDNIVVLSNPVAPEPASWLLLAAGGGFFALMRRRR